MKVIMSADEHYSVLPQNIEKLFYSKKKDGPDWAIWAAGSAGVTLLGMYAKEEDAREVYGWMIDYIANEEATGKFTCPRDKEESF